MQHWLKVHRAVIVIAVSMALIALIPFVFAHKAAAPEPAAPLPKDNSVITVTGTFTCVPHRDQTGPQTLECAMGMKSGGTHYMLVDTSGDYSLLSSAGTGDEVSVTGKFTEKHDEVYDSEGVIAVTAIKKL